MFVVGFEWVVFVVGVPVVVVAEEWQLVDHEKVWDLEMEVDRLDSVMAMQECFVRVAFSVPSEIPSQLQLQDSKSREETNASTHPQKQIYPVEPDEPDRYPISIPYISIPSSFPFLFIYNLDVLQRLF